MNMRPLFLKEMFLNNFLTPLLGSALLHIDVVLRIEYVESRPRSTAKY